MSDTSFFPEALFRDEHPGSFEVEKGNVCSPLTEFSFGVEILTGFEYFYRALYV
jgi:hypothetical protein